MMMATRPPGDEGLQRLAVTTTAVFTGHARLPQSIGLIDSSSLVSIEVEVDLATREVVHVSATGVLPRAAAWLAELLTGRDFERGMQAALEAFQGRYESPCQRAICSAIAATHEAYVRYCRREELLPEASPHFT